MASAKQRKGYEFLLRRKGRAFSVEDFAKATGYKKAGAATMLSEHWRGVVEKDGKKWRPRPRVLRLSLSEFVQAVSQSKRLDTRKRKLHVLLDASAIVPYYVPQATKAAKLATRIRDLIDEARSPTSHLQLLVPNFCIAEVFSVFMKHGFSSWSRHVKKTLTKNEYLAAVESFQEDIHNGKVILQCALNRYHILGINLVAPVDHHYQMVRPKRQTKNKRRPNPAGAFDQLIVSMGVQLARVHGAEDTLIVSADRRLVDLAAKCRTGIPGKVQQRLGLDRCEDIVGLPFKPETFPNVLDLQRARKRIAESLLDLTLSS